MLPKLKLFMESDIDKFLFAGMDLFEEMDTGEEKFRAFNDNLNTGGLYFISFAYEQVINDLLEQETVEKFLDKHIDIEIIDEPINGVQITYLKGFDYFVLIEFLKLLLEEFENIIE